MNNREQSRNGAVKHVALDRQGLIWESRARQLSPPEKPLDRAIADSALSPWMNLPAAVAGTPPTLPVRPFRPSLLPSQPPADLYSIRHPGVIPTVPGEEPATGRPPELFTGPAMRDPYPDASGLKPQTLEWRSDRDGWQLDKMMKPQTLEWRSDRDGKWWDDLPKTPPFSDAAGRPLSPLLQQAHGSLLQEGPPAAPPLWQGRLSADLSTAPQDITIHRRQGDGAYLTSVGGSPAQPLHEEDVATLTDLSPVRLQTLAAQFDKNLSSTPALHGAATRPQPQQETSQTSTEGEWATTSPQHGKPRMDRSWSELKHELAKVTVEAWREYPRTAEQAAANITMNGAELNEREVRMLYDMFHQKYPGWGKRPQVDPTPKKRMPLPPGTPVIEALKPHQLLEEANTQFDKAAGAFLASPANWIVDGVTGEKTGGFSFGPDHAWTRVLKNKPVYQRMRKGMSKIAAVEDKLGTLDSRIGWRGAPGKRGYTWDDSADDGPIYQPVVDLANYAAGFELKSTGSTKADIVITNVDHGNRTITFDVHVYDKLRAGSLTRFPGRTPFVGDKEILPDNPFGPFLYDTPVEWRWTETVNY